MIAAVLPQRTPPSTSTSDLLSDAELVWFPVCRPSPNSYTLTSTHPAWFFNAMQDLGWLQAKLGENWDSYGAKSISPQAIDLAIEILERVIQSDTPRPALVPSPAGHIQAEWHIGGLEIEVEFESATSIRVMFEDLHAPERDWESVLSTDLTKLSDAIAEISTRTP